jgi:hypothetical protein
MGALSQASVAIDGRPLARAKVLAPAADAVPMSLISGASLSGVLPSAASSGLATIAAGTQQLNQDAEQIATSTDGVPVTPLADLQQASLTAEAGAAVLRASDRMLGTILDIFA